MYAVHGPFPQHLILEEFSVCSSVCDDKAVSGQELQTRQPVRIQVVLSLKVPETNAVEIRLIHAGKLIKSLETALPAKVAFQDDYFQAGERTYYRIEARSRRAGRLLSNPIFVKFTTEKG